MWDLLSIVCDIIYGYVYIKFMNKIVLDVWGLNRTSVICGMCIWKC